MEKLYYSIKEVSQMVGVEEYVLRYWEKEFPQLKVRRYNGRRRYTKKDIERILLIKRLLYEEGFTIKGAKQKLNDIIKSSDPETVEDYRELLREIKEEIEELKRRLNEG